MESVPSYGFNRHLDVSVYWRNYSLDKDRTYRASRSAYKGDGFIFLCSKLVLKDTECNFLSKELDRLVLACILEVVVWNSAVLTDVFRKFPQSLQANTGVVPRLDSFRFEEFCSPTFRFNLVYCLGYSILKWRRHVLPKRQLVFNGLHGVISQNTQLLLTIAVRSPKPISFRSVSQPIRRYLGNYFVLT
jgi:hypothetical protein